MGASDLIREVRRTGAAQSPLDLVSIAVVRGVELSADADALVDHFVAEARRAGCSWTEIGDRLGVSKQAVRERFGGRLDRSGRDHYVPRLQRCVAAAGAIAQAAGSATTGPAHLLLSLASNEGVAGVVLDRLGVTPEHLTRALGELLGGSEKVDDVPTESSDLVDTLRSAEAFALERGHDYVGTEHVLFVLATDPGSRMRRVLEQLGVDPADVKRELARCLDVERPRRGRRRRRECRCSFCGSSGPEPLAKGPGVYICVSCARAVAEGAGRDSASMHHSKGA